MNNNSKSWHFNKQINLSVVIQLVLLAGLILGSWLNLQCRLNLLHRDVTQLLNCRKELTGKLEILSDKSISHEYRLQAVETQIKKQYIRSQ
jgi:hypothetical protein